MQEGIYDELPVPLKVKPNEPFHVRGLNLAPKPIDFQPVRYTIATIPLEVEGQGGAIISFERNVNILEQLSKGFIIPTGIGSLDLPVSVTVSLGKRPEEELKKAKCSIGFGQDIYKMSIYYDPEELDKEGVALGWFSTISEADRPRPDVTNVIFSPDPRVLSQIRFIIDCGTTG